MGGFIHTGLTPFYSQAMPDLAVICRSFLAKLPAAER